MAWTAMRNVGCLAATALLALLAAPAHAAAADAEAAPAPARWLTAANAALLPDASMVAHVTIVTHDGFGGETRRVEADVARVSEGETVRTLIEVEAPAEGAGAVYEVVARPGQPLERWVWLPELRRLRRIVGVQRTDPFLGTEFSYEDLGLALAEERMEGTARFVGEPPERRVELESVPYHYYQRVVTRIDPATALPTKILFYDHAGQLFREQRFEDVRQVDGHPFPTRIVVEDRLTGARSVLTFDSLRFGVKVPAERFTASELERRLEAAREAIPEAAEVGAAPEK